MTERIVRSGVVGAVLLALAALAACGGGEEAKPAEHAAPPAAEPAPPPEPAPAVTPAPPEEAPAAAVTPTFACIAGDAEQGKTKYAQLCASCHGATGGGDGVASAGLNPKPAHHDDGSYMNALSNEHLVKVIAQGGASVGKSPMMAPWGAALGTQGVLDGRSATCASPRSRCPCGREPALNLRAP